MPTDALDAIIAAIKARPHRVETCPRCQSDVDLDVARRRDCGPDSWDDDVTWAAYACPQCALVYNDWDGDWYDSDDYCPDDPEQRYAQ